MLDERLDEIFDIRDLEIDRFVDLPIAIRGRVNLKILVVVDSEISLADGPDEFGVGRLVKLLRATNVGCNTFHVDVAIRDTMAFDDDPTAGPGSARYRGFRFDSTAAGGDPVINGYHVILLFGFKPNNFGSDDDSVIDEDQYLPAKDEELAVLDTWMTEQQGGLFGTGDHHFLGASMCRRIPRLGTMRRWTNADQVPTIGGSTRLDTNQPSTPGQQAGSDVIPISAEEDAVPQSIEWVADALQIHGFGRHTRPHPVLCHPRHGVINVMPDHPHEGRVRTSAEIDLTATYDFGDGERKEYPVVGGQQPEPKVIAYGNTVPDPPFDHSKGPMPAVRFPMINVYDGHRVDIGRVLSDSTWHHWFNLNLQGIEAAADKADWDKISRYFINVVLWIAPPEVVRRRCWWEFIAAPVLEVGRQEFVPGGSALELGKAMRTHLVSIYGVCWVWEFVYRTLCDLDPRLCARLDRHRHEPFPDGPFPDVCLSCPPFELIEAAVLGGMVKATLPLAEKLGQAFVDQPSPNRRRRFDLQTSEIEQAALTGARRELKAISRNIVRHSKELGKMFA